MLAFQLCFELYSTARQQLMAQLRAALQQQAQDAKPDGMDTAQGAGEERGARQRILGLACPVLF